MKHGACTARARCNRVTANARAPARTVSVFAKYVR